MLPGLEKWHPIVRSIKRAFGKRLDEQFHAGQGQKEPLHSSIQEEAAATAAEGTWILYKLYHRSSNDDDDRFAD